MRPRRLILLSAPILILAACGSEPADEGAQPPATNAAANASSGPITDAPAVSLVGPEGNIVGSVQGGDSDQGAVMRIEARGLPPGVHGMHLHAVGLCEGPKFESAGAHWNPTEAQHGLEHPEGPHYGDLPNITVGEDGNFTGTVTIQGSYLKESRMKAGPVEQILDADGAALVIHALPDDGTSQPSGASGDRIACAALAPA